MAAALRQAGLESDPALRGLTADSYAPRAEALQTPPPEPPAAAPAADQAAPGASLATRAAQMGLDIADDGSLQRANALLENRAFPSELRAALDEARALQDQTARMADAYDAAATCAIRG
jgi:hypothetical protein